MPHFHSDAVQQVVTWHLADSLPRDAAGRLARLADTQEQRRLYESYLDAGHGSCVLADPVCAHIVQEALLHFDGERYRLLAWVIMPNHVHVLVDMLPGQDLGRIVQSWKRHTAQAINRHLGMEGALWRREYWDRYIRDEAHFRLAVDYIERNPVKAGLVRRVEDWRWSSAFRSGDDGR